MALRSARERIIQTLTFELIGVALVSPLYVGLVGAPVADSILLITLLSVVILVWSPLHNVVFDFCELRFANRLASDRPHRVRVFHALSHEITAVMITCPLMIVVGGHSLMQALSLNVGLTLFYSGYAYVFHLAYDKLRPVRCPVGAKIAPGSPQEPRISGI